MLFLFSSFALSVVRSFKLRQTIWPPAENELGLFGRSVSFSRDRIAIGSEYLDIDQWKFPSGDNRIGAVYVYDYDSATNSYTISKGNNASYNRIEPKPDPSYPNVIPGTFSSRMALSDDSNTLIVGAPYTYVPKDTPGLVVVPNQDDKEEDVTMEFNGVEYYKEIGAIYVFKRNEDGSWRQTDISIPRNILYCGGYGRALSGNSDLSTFAGSYYNKFKAPIKKIGGVSVENLDNNGKTINQKYISPPDELTDKNSQRFGSTLDFFGTKEIYVSTTTRGDSTKSGVYHYTLKNDKWEEMEKIKAKGSDKYKEFGLNAAFRIGINDALVALYANNDEKDNAIFILSRDSDGWKEEPEQIIEIGSGELSEKLSDMFFCSHDDNNFLAVILDEKEGSIIRLYSQSPTTKKYELFQKISEPNVSRVNVPYSQQYISFASDFSWDSETCSRFIVGAMSKSGAGTNTKPEKYSRSYVYELVHIDDEKGSSHTGIIVGCVIACIAIIAIIIIVVIYIRNKNDDSIKFN